MGNIHTVGPNEALIVSGESMTLDLPSWTGLAFYRKGIPIRKGVTRVRKCFTWRHPDSMGGWASLLNHCWCIGGVSLLHTHCCLPLIIHNIALAAGYSVAPCLPPKYCTTVIYPKRWRGGIFIIRRVGPTTRAGSNLRSIEFGSVTHY